MHLHFTTPWSLGHWITTTLPFFPSSFVILSGDYNGALVYLGILCSSLVSWLPILLPRLAWPISVCPKTTLHCRYVDDGSMMVHKMEIFILLWMSLVVVVNIGSLWMFVTLHNKLALYFCDYLYLSIYISW